MSEINAGACDLAAVALMSRPGSMTPRDRDIALVKGYLYADEYSEEKGYYPSLNMMKAYLEIDPKEA